jgi:CheY-like chemotaxis protein
MKLLIVDDDPGTLLGLSETLKGHPEVTIEMASSAEDALSLLYTAGDFDAVLSDVRMLASTAWSF